MPVIVMKRKFESPPSKDEILSLVAGNAGDQAQAKAALASFIAPLKDLLALYEFADNLDAAGKYAEMLSEIEATKTALSSVKVKLDSGKDEFKKIAQAQDVEIQKSQGILAQLNLKIQDLENQKSALTKEIADEEKAKLRINKAVSDEYDRLRAEMLAKIATEEKAAGDKLAEIEVRILAAQAELDNLAEAKRKFLASLGAQVAKKQTQDRTAYAISTKASRKAGKRSFSKAKKGKNKKKARGKN